MIINMFIQFNISVVVMGSLLPSCFRSKYCVMYVSVGGLCVHDMFVQECINLP